MAPKRWQRARRSSAEPPPALTAQGKIIEISLPYGHRIGVIAEDLFVVHVHPDGPAARALRVGDRLVALNDVLLRDQSVLRSILQGTSHGPLELTIWRPCGAQGETTQAHDETGSMGASGPPPDPRHALPLDEAELH